SGCRQRVRQSPPALRAARRSYLRIRVHRPRSPRFDRDSDGGSTGAHEQSATVAAVTESRKYRDPYRGRPLATRDRSGDRRIRRPAGSLPEPDPAPGRPYGPVAELARGQHDGTERGSTARTRTMAPPF